MANEPLTGAGTQCVVLGRSRQVSARAMCLMQYKRARTATNPHRGFSFARFDDYMDKGGPVPELRPDLGPCWEWTGARNATGYGITPKPFMGTRLAHRVSLALDLGEAVTAEAVMHLCDNPACCRPSHLKPGTRRENSLDAKAKGRTVSGKEGMTECKNGHPRTPANTRKYQRPDGYIETKCIPCRKLWGKELARKRKALRQEKKRKQE